MFKLLLQHNRPASRLRGLWLLFLVYLLINTATRLTLALYDGERAHTSLWTFLQAFSIGWLYDIAAFAWWAIPFVLLMTLAPSTPRGRCWHGRIFMLLAWLAMASWIFTAVAEFLFWNEFSARFNFIAVDYLVYTREVLGNIQQSYPVGAIFAGIGVVALLLLLIILRPLRFHSAAEAPRWPRRLAYLASLSLLPLLSFAVIDDREQQSLPTIYTRELAGNGYYSFMRAFRNNELDYFQYYKTLPAADIKQQLRAHWQQLLPEQMRDDSGAIAVRQVRPQGEPQKHHVILVSIESLGADYTGYWGGDKPGLTPNLDRLAGEGMAFTQMYATGLRTVRGLEALSLSLPPTPGHAVVMRPRNKGLQTLGSALKQQGYDPLYIYGGYSTFDNMQDFFAGNEYTVLDRDGIAKENIHHETIWGVADEDLFDYALQQMDERTGKGEKVFAHIMTTTNHRTYTYPDGRIDIPSGDGREGAVKYTDWAIGQFIEKSKNKSWFKNTLFVFVADHTSHGRGRTDLPPENYRIPMVIYAPALIGPQVIDTLASQIDVAPTVMGLLNVAYDAQFFGQDILREGARNPRAFMANYVTIGYMENGLIAELNPMRRYSVVQAENGVAIDPDSAQAKAMIEKAIAWYQSAADAVAQAKE